MILSKDLGFLGLHIRARISSGDRPNVTCNLTEPLLLNFQKMKNIFPTSYLYVINRLTVRKVK